LPTGSRQEEVAFPLLLSAQLTLDVLGMNRVGDRLEAGVERQPERAAIDPGL